MTTNSNTQPKRGSIRDGIMGLLDGRKEQSEFLIGKYHPGLETQVMCFPGGEDAGNNKWTDGSQTWGDSRWPHNAMTSPVYSDKTLTFNPASHVRFIGTTWWSYVDKESVGVGFDIDAEEGHAVSTTTVNELQLEQVIERASALDYVTIVKSKSGQGVHVYVFFDENDRPQAENHTVHKDTAQAVLAKMCQDMDYDLKQHVDVFGSVLWIYSSEVGEGGFDLVKDQTKAIGAKDLEGHYDKSVASPSINDYTGGPCRMDERHKEFCKQVEVQQFDSNWVKEHNMLQCRTTAIKQAVQSSACFKEDFETITRDDTRPNCWMVPTRNGFKIGRFGNGVSEHESWIQEDGKTFFYLTFKEPDPSLEDLYRVGRVEGHKHPYYFRPINGKWAETTERDLRNRMAADGLKGQAMATVLGTTTPFTLVNEPLQPEFLGDRVWNLCKTKLAHPVSDTPGAFDTFQKILDHCGPAFNQAVLFDPWCQEHEIATGADYLKLWIARLLRFPKERLPGIGFFSEGQNCGKSAFCGCVRLLFTPSGYCGSDRALTTNFNGQLQDVVLWDFDDSDLAQDGGRKYNRLQTLMTSDRLHIEAKGREEVSTPNTLHIVHTANKIDSFTIQPGDTRWILGEVEPLEEEIPQQILTERLKKEAPFFLRALFDLEFPEPAGRMYLPVLDTPLKYQLMAERELVPLTPDQRNALDSLQRAAMDGRLADWTTFSELCELTGIQLTVQQFKSCWSKIAAQLEAQGFQTAHRPNGGGRKPAAYVIHQPECLGVVNE